MRRREFIATGCIACLGAGSLSALLSSCAEGDLISGKMVEGNITVPLPGPGTVHIVRADGFPDEIALVRGHDGEFHALLLRCTHADNPLRRDGEGFSCSLHGSRFNLEGRVTHGPATRPLRAMKVSIIGDSVTLSPDS